VAPVSQGLPPSRSRASLASTPTAETSSSRSLSVEEKLAARANSGAANALAAAAAGQLIDRRPCILWQLLQFLYILQELTEMSQQMHLVAELYQVDMTWVMTLTSVCLASSKHSLK